MRINYRMGVISSYMNHMEYGYYGWPTVAKLDDQSLVVGASGFRRTHMSNDGKIVIYYGDKEGKTWSPPRIAEDSPIDDRDTGVICLGGKEILISWFTGQHFNSNWDLDEKTNESLKFWTKEMFDHYNGSFVKVTKDEGKTFSEKIRVKVTTPHGPIKLQNGILAYLGNVFDHIRETPELKLITSSDGGHTWSDAGSIPYSDDVFEKKGYHEPHLLEISENHLLGVIRDQSVYKETGRVFRVLYSHSYDNGQTWEKPLPMGIDGSPPHLMRHSSGAIICTYGYRELDFLEEKNSGSGQRAIISYDDGITWTKPYMISDHIDTIDVGYPSTVELFDGSLFTVYYQRESHEHLPGLLYSKWNLPE